jgi:Mannosyltransferase putative
MVGSSSLTLFCTHGSERVLLDANQVPVRDPSEVFQWPQYLDTGALFWPDTVEQRMQLILFGESDLEIEFLRCNQFGTGRGPLLQNSTSAIAKTVWS